MKDARWHILFFRGLAAAVLFAARRAYGRRSRERVVSHEGLDDPGVAQAVVGYH
jgi:uncharacterized membrane protein